MASRIDQLADFVCTRLDADAQSVDPSLYLELVKRLNVRNPEALREKIITNLVAGARKDINETMQAHLRTVHAFADVDAAQDRATTRRHRVQRGDKLPREELPVRLHDLSTEDLVDCHLREARKQWLAELHDRRRVVAQQLDALRNECDARREKVRALLADAGVGISALQQVYAAAAGEQVDAPHPE